MNPLVGFTPFIYIESELFHPPRAVALGIGGAAPELLAGVDAFTRHSFYHGLRYYVISIYRGVVISGFRYNDISRGRRYNEITI